MLSRLLGDDRRESTPRHVRNRDTTGSHPKASAPALQQLDADRALLIESEPSCKRPRDACVVPSGERRSALGG